MIDSCITKYLDIQRNQNAHSAETIAYYLKDLQVFCALKATDKENPVCEVIKKLKAGTFSESPKEEQVYEVLSAYASWLKKERLDTGSNNALTVKYKLSWARTLFEVNFITISKALFKALVKSPKQAQPETSPVDKKTVVTILLALEDLRMRTYVMFLASTGWRASETLTLRVSNLESFDIKTLKFIDTPFINASGKHAKTKTGKRRQLTNETAKQIEKLLAFNYRRRNIHRKNPDGSWGTELVAPVPKAEDKLFAPYHSEVSVYYKLAQEGKVLGDDRLDNLYHSTSKKFRETTDRLAIKFEESGNRRKVTLHSFRRFVFTQCERAVGLEYAKYHTGRKTHEYSKRSTEEIADDFATVEPYLTFLDTTAMELRQKSLESKVRELDSAFQQAAYEAHNVETEKEDLQKQIDELRKELMRMKDNKEE